MSSSFRPYLILMLSRRYVGGNHELQAIFKDSALKEELVQFLNNPDNPGTVLKRRLYEIKVFLSARSGFSFCKPEQGWAICCDCDLFWVENDFLSDLDIRQFLLGTNKLSNMKKI